MRMRLGRRHCGERIWNQGWTKGRRRGVWKGAQAVATCPCRLNLICANARGEKGSQNNSQRNKPRSNWVKGQGGGWGRQLGKRSDCVNMYMEYVCVCVNISCVCLCALRSVCEFKSSALQGLTASNGSSSPPAPLSSPSFILLLCSAGRGEVSWQNHSWGRFAPSNDPVNWLSTVI